MKNSRDHLVQARFPPEVKEWLKKHARARGGISIASALREIIMETYNADELTQVPRLEETAHEIAKALWTISNTIKENRK